MDEWLMEKFGRPPDEFDDTDLARIQRACQVKRLREFKQRLDSPLSELGAGQADQMVNDPLFARFLDGN